MKRITLIGGVKGIIDKGVGQKLAEKERAGLAEEIVGHFVSLLRAEAERYDLVQISLQGERKGFPHQKRVANLFSAVIE